MKHDPRAIEAERVDLALRLLAVTLTGIGVQRLEERWHVFTPWQGRLQDDWPTLESAITAAEAEEAKR